MVEWVYCALCKRAQDWQDIFKPLSQVDSIHVCERCVTQVVRDKVQYLDGSRWLRYCSCEESSGCWFDRTISLRVNGSEGMANICNDCGHEVI